MPGSCRIGFKPAPSSGGMATRVNGGVTKVSTARKKPSMVISVATTHGISQRARGGGATRR